MQHLSNPNISDILYTSLRGVFDTMLSFRSEAKGFEDLSGQKPVAPRISGGAGKGAFVGSVGYVGEVSGVLYLFVSSEFAFRAASKITGLEDGEVDNEIVVDVCGELTNMLAGTFKNTLADQGYASTLTIPTVLSGHDLLISSVNVMTHLRNSYLVDGQEVFVDLAMGS